MMFLLLISFAVLFLVMELRYHPITRQGVLRTLNISRLGFEVPEPASQWAQTTQVYECSVPYPSSALQASTTVPGFLHRCWVGIEFKVLMLVRQALHQLNCGSLASKIYFLYCNVKWSLLKVDEVSIFKNGKTLWKIPSCFLGWLQSCLGKTRNYKIVRNTAETAAAVYRSCRSHSVGCQYPSHFYKGDVLHLFLPMLSTDCK